MSTFQNSAFDGSRRAGDFSLPMSHAPILVTVTGIKSNLWTVESSDHSVGGIFVSRKAALAFAHEAMALSNAAVVVNEDGITSDQRRLGRGFLGGRHRDANTPIQRPYIVHTRRRSKTASEPLFTGREVAIGFSLLALGAAVFGLA
jgi:hypothetical protein